MKKDTKIYPHQMGDIQQPVDRSGYTNPNFNKLYGDKKNPYTGTFRDVRYKGYSEKYKRKIGLQECA